MKIKFMFIVVLFLLLFSSCSNEMEYKEYKIIDLSKPFSDTLEFNKEDRIIGVEISITGNLKGTAVLEFENGAGRFTKVFLENKVSEIYEAEWYSSKLNFNYLPESKISGDSLVLRFRMY